jgi:hypothetical protein
VEGTLLLVDADWAVELLVIDADVLAGPLSVESVDETPVLPPVAWLPFVSTVLLALAEEETSEVDEEATGTIELVDWTVPAAELLRALDEFAPAALPDLVLLTDANWPEM